MLRENVLVFWFCLCLCSTVSMGRVPKMVIDHDGGADDAMAILMALLYEKNFNGPQIVALTTVHGNVNETQAYINTQRILDVADRRDIPIYRGSESALVIDYPTDGYFGKDGLGDLKNVSYRAVKAEPLQAALALIKLSKQYRGELILVTIGTLTNVALAIKLDPGFIGRTKHIYVGAGHLFNEDFSGTQPEFNVMLDVEAYHILAQHSVPDKVTVIPFSVILNNFTITTDWRINVLGKIPTNIMKALNRFERVNLPKNRMWQLLDPSVVAIALDKRLVANTKLTNNSVILCGEGKGLSQRGITTNDFNTTKGNMNLVYSAFKNVYQTFLIRVFSEQYYEKH